jgi:hypothetical protein
LHHVDDAGRGKLSDHGDLLGQQQLRGLDGDDQPDRDRGGDIIQRERHTLQCPVRDSFELGGERSAGKRDGDSDVHLGVDDAVHSDPADD